jgi:hypothetical protein
MPQRAVEKQLKRRRLIHECMLLGINDNPGILSYLKRNDVIVSEKTMIKDRLAVRAEFKAGYERHADELRSDILAELDGSPTSFKPSPRRETRSTTSESLPSPQSVKRWPARRSSSASSPTSRRYAAASRT